MSRLCEWMSVWVTLVRLKQNKAPAFPQPCWIGLFPTDVVYELTFFCRLSSWAVVSLIPHVSLYLDSAPSSHPNSTSTGTSPFPILQCPFPFHSYFALSFCSLSFFFLLLINFTSIIWSLTHWGAWLKFACHTYCTESCRWGSWSHWIRPLFPRVAEIFFADKVAALQENPKKKSDCLMLENLLSPWWVPILSSSNRPSL